MQSVVTSQAHPEEILSTLPQLMFSCQYTLDACNPVVAQGLVSRFLVRKVDTISGKMLSRETVLAQGAVLAQ